jgi:hypothetical protein
MTGIIRLTWLIAALAQGGSIATPRETPPHYLAQIVAQLGLTGAGSGRWQTALGDTPGTVTRERLVVMSTSGKVVATKDGSETAVLFGPEIECLLATAGADLVLVHNHPDNSSLSANDLAQLARPGVAAVVVLAHDRSLYAAIRSSRYDAAFFLERQYDVVRLEIRKWLRIEGAAGTVRPAAADAHFSHVAALALAKAHVIEYRAELAPSARESFGSGRRAFAHVVAATASVLSRGALP